MNGAVTRRDTGLVPLMLADNGVRRSDGANRLNGYLTGGQRAVLEALPPLAADRGSVQRFDALVASRVVRRGPALAARTGARWPVELADATLGYVAREVGLRL
jgi:hypothetical protein